MCHAADAIWSETYTGEFQFESSRLLRVIGLDDANVVIMVIKLSDRFHPRVGKQLDTKDQFGASIEECQL